MHKPRLLPDLNMRPCDMKTFALTGDPQIGLWSLELNMSTGNNHFVFVFSEAYFDPRSINTESKKWENL